MYKKFYKKKPKNNASARKIQNKYSFVHSLLAKLNYYKFSF